MTISDPDPIVIRHRWPDRLFHWAMAVAVLILLLSAFLPIVGIKFDWLPWHWISGAVLTLLVLFHIIRAVLVQGLSTMLPQAADLRELWADTTGSDRTKLMAAKYDVYQKSVHWLSALIVLGLVITGLPMLLKLDTVLWDRDPGILSDIQWGYVYVIHGLCALGLIFVVILHIYFALLPEHKPLLLAMLTGRGPEHARKAYAKTCMTEPESNR